MTNDARWKPVREVGDEVHLSRGVARVDEIVRNGANEGAKIADELLREGARERQAPLPMRNAVAENHRVLQKIEQRPVGDTSRPSDLRFHLPGTRIGEQLLHVTGSDRDVDAVISLQQRRERAIVTKDLMCVRVELGTAYGK